MFAIKSGNRFKRWYKMNMHMKVKCQYAVNIGQNGGFKES